MGMANLGYVVLAAAAAVGLVAFAYSKIAQRPQMAPTAFVVFVIALVGMFVWSVYLSGLKETLAEVIYDGQRAQTNIEQERLSARLLGAPEPKPDESDVQAVAAMKRAQRTARQFGWDPKALKPTYLQPRKRSPQRR